MCARRVVLETRTCVIGKMECTDVKEREREQFQPTQEQHSKGFGEKHRFKKKSATKQNNNNNIENGAAGWKAKESVKLNFKVRRTRKVTEVN